MKGFIKNIEEETIANENFRKVLYTTKDSQLVLMNLIPKQEIGLEIHNGDQFFRFEKGEGKVIIDKVEHLVSDGFAVVVPSGAEHNIINTSATESLKLYTIYSPAHHRHGVVHITKQEAEKDDEHFDGKVSEE